VPVPAVQLDDVPADGRHGRGQLADFRHRDLLADRRVGEHVTELGDEAVGVLMQTLDELGLRCPEDISVIGFDDIHLAQFMLPPLTTVQMSCRDLAVAAVEGLRAGIEPDHPKHGKREWHIPTRLVVRQSSTFPRGSLPALSQAKRNDP